MIATAPAPRKDRQQGLLPQVVNGVTDFILFIVVLCFTGVAMLAVAIVAPLAVGISAIIGRPRQTRSSWKAS